MGTTTVGFPLFPNLPTEIRLKIWEYSAPRERVIEFSAKVPRDDRLGQQEYLRYLKRQEFNHRALGTGIRSDIYWFVTCPQPSILSVCHESREVALKIYTLAFDLAGTYYHSSHTVYLNPELDTVYCNTYSSLLVHYLLSDLQSCDDEGNGARLLALNENCLAEALVCRPPDGLRGSKYMEKLGCVTLITEQDDVPQEGRKNWTLVEGDMAPWRELRFQGRIGRKPLQFFNVAMRGTPEDLRPKLKFCALRNGVI